MKSDILEELTTHENFNENAYLFSNPDVAQAVKRGELDSGQQHFEMFGKNEGRKQQYNSSVFLEIKTNKLKKIKPLLRNDMHMTKANNFYDFLTEELRLQFNLVDTDAVSSHNYDMYAMEIINKYENGCLLDCGAGKRSVYFENVVNFEIASYETTDVR